MHVPLHILVQSFAEQYKVSYLHKHVLILYEQGVHINEANLCGGAAASVLRVRTFARSVHVQTCTIKQRIINKRPMGLQVTFDLDIYGEVKYVNIIRVLIIIKKQCDSFL